MTAWDHLASHYDFIVGDRTAMIAFYRSLVDSSVRSILELACGTGIILSALAEQAVARHGKESLRFVGVDQSESMLQIARARHPGFEWIRGDMRRPAVSGSFDLVFCCFNTLHECESEEEMLQMFRSVRDLLADRGTFAFDMYQPNVAYLSVPQRNRLVRRAADSTGKELELREDTEYDSSAKVYTMNWRVHEKGVESEPLVTGRYQYRQYPADDVERLLAQAGLAIRERFGGLDRSRFTAASKKQVVLCSLK